MTKRDKCMILSMIIRNIEQIKQKTYKKLRSKALTIRIKYDHVFVRDIVFTTVYTLFYTYFYIKIFYKQRTQAFTFSHGKI